MKPTFRSAVLAGLSAVDSVMGLLDMAPVTIDVVTRRWSLGEINRGTPGDSVTSLPRWTQYRVIAERESAQSGGRFRVGDIMIGPVRPYFVRSVPSPTGAGDATGNTPLGSPGGFRRQDLDPKVEDVGTEVFYRIRQAHKEGTGESGDFELVELVAEDPLQFMIVVRRRLSPSADPQSGDPSDLNALLPGQF